MEWSWLICIPCHNIVYDLPTTWETFGILSLILLFSTTFDEFENLFIMMFVLPKLETRMEIFCILFQRQLSEYTWLNWHWDWKLSKTLVNHPHMAYVWFYTGAQINRIRNMISKHRSPYNALTGTRNLQPSCRNVGFRYVFGWLLIGIRVITFTSRGNCWSCRKGFFYINYIILFEIVWRYTVIILQDDDDDDDDEE